MYQICELRENLGGLVRELNPGPLAPEARIIPLDQQAKCCDICIPSQYDLSYSGGNENDNREADVDVDCPIGGNAKNLLNVCVLWTTAWLLKVPLVYVCIELRHIC